MAARLNAPTFTPNVWISCTDILIKKRKGIWKAFGGL